MLCPKCLQGKMAFLLSYLHDKDVVLNVFENNEEFKESTEEKEKENEIYSKRKEFTKCPLNLIENANEFEKPIFLKDNWFDNLCLCESCLKLYKELDLENTYKLKDENVNEFLSNILKIIFIFFSL